MRAMLMNALRSVLTAAIWTVYLPFRLTGAAWELVSSPFRGQRTPMAPPPPAPLSADEMRQAEDRMVREISAPLEARLAAKPAPAPAPAANPADAPKESLPPLTPERRAFGELVTRAYNFRSAVQALRSVGGLDPKGELVTRLTEDDLLLLKRLTEVEAFAVSHAPLEMLTKHLDPKVAEHRLLNVRTTAEIRKAAVEGLPLPTSIWDAKGYTPRPPKKRIIDGIHDRMAARAEAAGETQEIAVPPAPAPAPVPVLH